MNLNTVGKHRSVRYDFDQALKQTNVDMLSSLVLKQIGFFHYGDQDKTRPIDSLETSLNARSIEGPLVDSLIVLPEAFNIRTLYERDREPSFTNREVICQLQKLGQRFDVAFVAGLILKDAEGPELPYNMAYLITSNSLELLSRKQTQDDLAGTFYQSDPGGFNRPTPFEEMCVAALICIDATVLPYPHLPWISNGELHERLRTATGKLANDPTILCVPACTRYFDASRIADEWADVHFVFANGGPKASVIRLKGQAPIAYGGDTNKVIVTALECQTS